MNPHLRVTMVQAELAWQEPAANRHKLATHFRGLAGHTDLVVLPEMFSTGFSMDAEALAEDMDGPTLGWMREEA
ncbi:MAG TPA: nitrilase-related carbon-nitrogen hydrolase, partial [Steroidobacteraceae bacterium]